MKKIWKIIIVIAIIGAIVGLGYLITKWCGLDNLDSLRKIVDNSIWGMLIFSLILILQVLFLPAGTLFFTGAAVIIFESPLKAWLICWFSLAIGSWIMFWLARKFGTKILKWIAGSEKAEKYATFLGKGKFVLPLILLVPIFPDDLICLAAGLSNINWAYFMVVVFITRGIDNFCTVFIGANMLKSTVGIILLVVFIIAMIIAAYFLTKHKDKIENYFLNLFTKKKKQTSTENEITISSDTETVSSTNTNKPQQQDIKIDEKSQKQNK